MRPERGYRLDLWSLLDVYRCTIEIWHEAALQLPLAIADEWSRIARS
ncbi:hypothetical protein [Methylobacterium sp. A54F]